MKGRKTGPPSEEPKTNKDFELSAAICLNRTPLSSEYKEFRLEFYSSEPIKDESQQIALADKHQTSMRGPWSSFPSAGPVTLVHEDNDQASEERSLNKILYQLDAEENKLVMTFRVEHLPHGEVAIPRSCLERTSRFGPRTVDLDPSDFVNAIRNVRFQSIFSNCDTDGSTINVHLMEVECIRGDVRSRSEDQNVEYKYPEGSWSFGNFIKAAFNKYLIPLLNGAAESEIELWLGVDKNGRNIGGTGRLAEIRDALANVRLKCFPPVHKKQINVEIYPVTRPASGQEFVVEWYKTVEEAQRRIMRLEGHGWQVQEEDGVNGANYGVVLEKRNEMANPDAVLVTTELFSRIRFERYICCVKVRSRFREAYINSDVQFGTLSPFSIWLRCRKRDHLFSENIRSSSSIGFQIGGKREAIKGVNCYFDPKLADLDSLLVNLQKNPKKNRFVIFSIDMIGSLLDILQKDNLSQCQSVHYDQTLPKWFVAPLFPLRSDMAELSTVKHTFRAFSSQMQVVDILCDEFSQELPKAKPGLFSRRGMFDIVGVKLPHNEMVDCKKDAEQFLSLEQPRNYVSWAIAEYYVVLTKTVRDVVDRVLNAVERQEQKQLILVNSAMPFSGVSCSLKKAALICAEKASTNWSVVFLREPRSDPVLEELETYLSSEAHAGRKCVIFQDAHEADEVFDKALNSLLEQSPFCCLVRGSYNILLNSKNRNLNVVTVSCVWDAADIKDFCDVIVQRTVGPSDYNAEIVARLDEVVQDAEVNGCCPFFALPLVIRQGEYVPIKYRIQKQMDIFTNLGVSDLGDCLAFISATCRDTVHRYLRFSRSVDLMNANPHSLLKALDLMGTTLFVHYEAGRAYIWVRLTTHLPRKDSEHFPVDPDVFAGFFEKVTSFIMQNPSITKPDKIGLLQEICFGRVPGPFSIFSSFLVRHPALLEKTYTSEFLDKLSKFIPECDVCILMSMLNKHLERYDRALDYALVAITASATANRRKAISNLASVYYSRYTAQFLDTDYVLCKSLLTELLTNEMDESKKSGFEGRLERLNNCRAERLAGVKM